MDVALVAQRAEDFAVLAGLVPITDILVCEDSDIAAELAAAVGARLFTLEAAERCRRAYSNEDLDLLVRRFGGELGGRHLTILPYAATATLDHLARSSGGRLRVAMPRPWLKRRLDHKGTTRRALESIGVPTVASMDIGRDVDFNDLRRALGAPFIVQRAISSGGVGTFSVSTCEELRQITSEERVSLVAAPMVGEQTINVHGFVDPADGAVSVSPMSVQLEGVTALCDGPFTYCGNDFRAVDGLSVGVRSQIAAAAHRVGTWMRSLGWWGVFGIDVRVAGRRLWVLEINPRFQGSTWALAHAERSAGAPSLAARQLQVGCVGRPLDWRDPVEIVHLVRHRRSDDGRGEGQERSVGPGAVIGRELLEGPGRV